MTTPIDERTAWHLVRAVRPGGGGESPPQRVHYDPRPGVWLQVQASGQWKASTPVTEAARDLLDLYVPLQVHANLVIGQTGQSLDGRIATQSGHSHYVTGPEDIVRLHRLRALVDAVVVGANTIESDNPRLTVREVEGENPVRVVLDPEGRLSAERYVFSDGAARTLVLRRLDDGVNAPVGDDRDRPTEGPPGHGVAPEVLSLAVIGSTGFPPHAILEALRDQGLRRILVEGGGVTLSRFIQAGALDRLHVAVAALLIGSGRSALTLEPIDELTEAIRPHCRHFRIGDDILFDLDLRRAATVTEE